MQTEAERLAASPTSKPTAERITDDLPIEQIKNHRQVVPTLSVRR